MVAAAGAGVGRAARATWLMVARGVGGTARSVGRAHDIDPGHRRDGIALALLGVAVVIAASSWFDAARPVGAWIDGTLRTLIGSAVILLPIALAVVAVMLMRTEPNPESRPRLILGAAMITLPAFGLWHLWSGSPDTPVGRQHASGFIGFAIGGPLSDGLSEWIAAPLLFIGVLFGVLLLTGTTIREVPATLRAMFGTRMFRRGEYDADDYDEYEDEPDANPAGAQGFVDDFSDGYYDDPSAYADECAGVARRARRWTTTRSPRTRRPSPSLPRAARRERKPTRRKPKAGQGARPGRRGALHPAVAGSAGRR